MTIESSEWPVDPGPAGGFTGDPGAGGTPPPGDPGAKPGSPAPPPGQQPPPANAEPPQPPTPTIPEGYIPQYRLDQLTKETKRLQAVISQLLGTPAQGEPKAPPDPRTESIRAKLLDIFPGLKHVDDLVQSNESRQTEESQRQNTFAIRTIGGVLDHCAAQMLGEGKTAKDFGIDEKVWLKDSFISWVLNDADRKARYDAGDTAGMAGEFWTAYNRVMRASAVRQQNTTVIERGQRRANLPSQGSSAAPMPTTPPALDYKDERAVHKAGWQATQPG